MILSIRPALVTIMAWYFLKESFGVFEVSMILLSLIGVVLVMQPPVLFGSENPNDSDYSTQEHFVTTIFALLAALVASICDVITRSLKVKMS